jgi:hypothetical protein
VRDPIAAGVAKLYYYFDATCMSIMREAKVGGWWFSIVEVVNVRYSSRREG